LTEVEKNIPSAYLALGEIYLYNGEDKKSLALSESAFKMNPRATNAIQLYTEALLRNNGKEAAKQFIDKQASEYPDNSILDNGFEKEAQEQVSQIISNPKLTSDELLQFARISIQAGWYDLAEKILKRSSNIPESKDISYYFLARVSEMKNNTNQAIDEFQQVLTGPFHVLSQIRASVLLTDNKRYDEALTVLSRT
ncbi:MAG TPA: hypothetical protein PLD88_00870, partial [Candidatus Berkiella sp.]|nr:hypothetical protein [Candidatus Berkiella sp.]